MDRKFKFLLPLLWGGLAIALVMVASNITYNNDNWLPADNPEQQASDLLTREFEQNSEQLLISFILKEGSNFFTKPMIDIFSEFSDRLIEIENVDEINSPLEATVILEDGDTLQIQSYRRALENEAITDYQEYRRLLTKSPYYGLLIAKDYSIITFSARVHSVKQAELRAETLNNIYLLLEEYQDIGEISVAGNLRLNAQLNSSTHGELGRLLLLTALILSGFLLLMFGKFWRVGLLFGTASICVLSSISIIVLFGHDLTIISLTLPIMIVVIAVADCLHIMGYWDDLRQSETFDDAGTLLKRVMGYSWRPCLNTSLTTAIGFGSFALSDILPLQQFGRDAAVAIMVSYVIMMLAMTSGLFYVSWQKPTSKRDARNDAIISAILRQLLKLVHARSKTITIFSLLTLIITGTALGWARTETNLLDVFFKPNSEIYQAFNLIDDELGGSGSVDIIFTKNEEEFFRSYQPFAETLRLEKFILGLPLVKGVQSYLDPVREVHEKFADDGSATPDNDGKLNQELLFLDFSRSADKQDVLAPYLDFNAERIRVKVQLPNLSSTKLAVFLAELNQNLPNYQLPNAVITGHSAFFQTLSDYVVRTQLSSIAFTFILIFFVLLVQFGFSVSLIGIVATSLPVVMTLGTVSLLGLPFDFATVIIAAVAMGISVDDNIHIMHCYSTKLKQTGNHNLAMESAIMIPGKPVLKTSLLFMLGIGIFASSDLVILTRFGIFATQAMFLAWFSSTMLLPAMLNLLQPSVKQIKA